MPMTVRINLKCDDCGKEFPEFRYESDGFNLSIMNDMHEKARLTLGEEGWNIYFDATEEHIKVKISCKDCGKRGEKNDG